jgi:ligand-binding SRPBCC domain-containing protein
VKVHTLRREQSIPASIGRVFDFFSKAENLEVLTPPWLYPSR